MSRSKSNRKPPKRQLPYQRAPYTSAIERAKIVGLYLADWTKTAIAKQLGLNRETVSRVLSQSEVEMLLQTYRSNVLQMVPDALKGLHVLIRELDRTALSKRSTAPECSRSARKSMSARPSSGRTVSRWWHSLGSMGAGQASGSEGFREDFGH